MIEVVTVNGSIFLEEPPGFDWDEITNPKIEGHIFYKGFRANYCHGDDPGEEHMLFGKVDNINNAGLLLQGDNMKEYTEDFHDAVDDFMEQVSRGAYGGHPIEYYTDSPEILAYYTSHYRNRGIFDLETMINIQKAVMQLEAV